MLKKIKPIIIENSKIPVWLSKIAPINIWAIICRGNLTSASKQHEMIHFHQQLEMLFIFQWLMYGIFCVIGRFKHGSWKNAYYQNPFEREAYANELEEGYLSKRKFWAWTKHIK